MEPKFGADTGWPGNPIKTQTHKTTVAFNYQVIITQPVLVGLKVDDDDFNHTKNFIIQTYFAKKKKTIWRKETQNT